MAEPPLQTERRKCRFSVTQLTHFLNGGEEETKLKSKIFQAIRRDPFLYHPRPFDMTLEQQREWSVVQLVRVTQIFKELGEKDPEYMKSLIGILCQYDNSFEFRSGVHFGLFGNTINSQGTKQQQEYWEPRVRAGKVIGCFAMTELGHSSHLRGLETTATYDHQRSEFIIHSPTLTSTKWWIGNAGQLATHSVVLADLIANGQSHGLHYFVVKLRDEGTGKLEPGVAAGDVGPKAGRNGVDNGWIQFTHKRIPQDNMLMKWSTISPDGKIQQSIGSEAAYLPLISERLHIIKNSAVDVSICLTIGARYTAIRTQGDLNQPILDYPTHYGTLIPILAETFALMFSTRQIAAIWDKQREILKPETFIMAKAVHGLSSAMKSWSGFWAMDSFERIRRLLGGHSYSAYNNIHQKMNDFAVITTGGGDNIVLAQQSAKYLLGSLKLARANKLKVSVLDDVTFMLEQQELRTFKTASQQFDPTNIDDLLFALKWLALTSLDELQQKIEFDEKQLKQNNPTKDALWIETMAWNEHMLASINTTQPYYYYNMIKSFQAAIQHGLTGIEATILNKLNIICGITSILKMNNMFIEFGFFERDHYLKLKQTLETLLKDIRQDIVPLVDAFDYPDWFLKAPLGSYDGDVYQNYFSVVSSARQLNPDLWAKHVVAMTMDSKL